MLAMWSGRTIHYGIHIDLVIAKEITQYTVQCLCIYASMEERVKITVSYAGIDKRIPLVVTPSLELSDEQVTYAERELHGVIRHVFKIPHESLFYLHEAESGRIMSRETFREPTQLSDFPRHWYLTVENYNGTGAVVDMEEKVGCVCVLCWYSQTVLQHS